ncbi:helix-turn-helix domain-containing protein [Buttiauxella izardii]|uniref:helix-turn-helix domain-containing protein n=1 Tax=Buttiauxella izardii TaxID=82991 RepID=UPI00142D7A0B|nr:helix-turn-helix domain-containing protein [Buttiauxella izardii]
MSQALASIGTEQTFQPGTEINAIRDNEKSLYLFAEGYFSVIRNIDGLVLSSVRGELVFGIAECLRPRGGWFLKVEETCTARVVPADQAFAIFTQQQLWEPVASLLSWFIQIYSLREEHLVGVSAYVMVRNKLIELHSLAPDLRCNINVADFIQERTQLARSTIMAILGELRRGDYVEIKRGKLLAIKLLPKEY